MNVNSIQNKAGYILNESIKKNEGERKFVEIFRELDRGEEFMDKVIKRALNGADFSPKELIAIQAGIYNYTQKLELFSKLVDRAASCIRQVLSSQ